ncbi:MAG: tetratricopeptide repeat protein [Actinobacteria bacterium]|nr:tetratricopeptide repeat protein [Actinomycetota bacterium]
MPDLTEDKTELHISLPTGTVTFLMTDVEGSTKLWEADPEAMGVATGRLDDLLTEKISAFGGLLPRDQGEGDSLIAVFTRSTDAARCALEIQKAIAEELWPSDILMKVRMALHSGEAEVRKGNYHGPALNRCARIRDLAHGGQVLISEIAHNLIREQLPAEAIVDDLGIHALKDLREPEHIYQLGLESLPREFPPLRSVSVAKSNLPHQLTTFVGRASALDEIPQALTRSRLVTLTGPGGTGKTRLSQEVGRRVLDRFRDGVWLVELASVPVGGLVVQAVSGVLGVREEPGRPMDETLSGHLREAEMLIILDNCEHLIEAASQLANTILRAAPEVRILATSREALRVPGEVVWALPPLSHPVPEDSTPELLDQYEAPKLFVDRAFSANPGFALNSENAPFVAEICQRLDGSPLAIELTSAWLNVLTPQQIVSKLRDKSSFPAGSNRTLPARHQTLEATVGWSYDLLSDEEQDLFVRLSLFVGPFSLEAAERVGGAEEVPRDRILELLSNLVAKSLIQSDLAGEAVRYSMLQTIREYGLAKLGDSGDEAKIRTRYLKWFVARAAEAGGDLRGPRQGYWLEQLEQEHDDIRAAFSWAFATGRELDALKMAGDLWLFWFIRGYLSEGRGILEKALTVCHDAPEDLRARAMYSLGVLAQNQGETEEAGGLFHESLEIYRRIGDSKGISTSLIALGNAADRQGDYEGAEKHFTEALELRREADDRSGMSTPLLNLGNVAFRMGDFDRARAYYEESLEIKREIGDEVGLASALHNLSAVLSNLGEAEEARNLEEQALDLRRKLGDKRGIGASLHSLADVAMESGNLEDAKAKLGEALEILNELGDRQGIAQCLLGYAEAALREGQMDRAGRLYAAFEGLSRQLHFNLPSADRQVFDEEVSSVRESLGEAEFTKAWQEGSSMSLDDVVTLALDRDL